MDKKKKVFYDIERFKKEEQMRDSGKGIGKNLILSKNLSKPIYDPAHIENENVLLIGSAGSGKNYSFIIPNILEMTGSYVIHDAGGCLYTELGDILKENGYKVMVAGSKAISEKYQCDLLDSDELKYVFNEKTAIFVISDLVYHDEACCWIPNLMEQVQEIAHKKKELQEPVKYPLTFVLNEFPNLPKIEELETYLSTGKRYRISYILAVQELSQIAAVYEDTFGNIVGNCHIAVYMGKIMPGMIDEMTWLDRDPKTLPKKHRKDPILRKEDIYEMDKDTCLISIINTIPVFDKKYDLKDHPLYEKLKRE